MYSINRCREFTVKNQRGQNFIDRNTYGRLYRRLCLSILIFFFSGGDESSLSLSLTCWLYLCQNNINGFLDL